jgi:hypothetical protein
MIRANAQLIAIGLASALIAAVSQGCGSKTAAGCDSSKCAAQNTCITETDPATMKSDTSCRRLCTSQTDPMTGCPPNYTCVPDTEATPQTYCSKNLISYGLDPNGKPLKGQFGSPCNPAGGLDANPDCDQTGGFWCNGASPTDGNAYCTQFDCKDDRECGAGFYCGTINRFPNVQTSKPMIGNVVKACIKRQFCAPCQTDIDCLPVANNPAHCVGDSNGAKFCATECSTDKGCNSEAFCANTPDADHTVCYPRANVCVGDAGLCAPCRSDADCLQKDGTQGACVRGEFSTEQSCAIPAPMPCFDMKGNQLMSGCPKMGEAPAAQIGCLGGVDFKEIPANYCHGVVPFSGSITPGCYTPKR